MKTVSVTAAMLLESSASNADRVWVQIAVEGEFKGYRGGELPFKFDRAVFDQIVANFRKSKSYKLGADGLGASDVIAWDFHHASEAPANSGEIPTMGAPAQCWIQELDVRRGAGGKAELWAFTRWLEPAKTYIKAGQYKWASVAVVLNAVDAQTGAQLGPMLTSVAITNRPFIEGMQSLAASRDRAAATMINP